MLATTTITFSELENFDLGFNGQFNPFLVSSDGQFRVEAFWLNTSGHFHIFDGGAGNLAEHNHNNSFGFPPGTQGIRISRVDGEPFELTQMDLFGQAAIGSLTDYVTGDGAFTLYNGSGTFAVPGTTVFGSTYVGVSEIYLADPGRAGGFSEFNSWDNIVLKTGLSVIGSSPADGEVVFPPAPTEFVIDLSNAVDESTLGPEDLTVDGIPADDVSVTTPTTLTFTFNSSPAAGQGLHTIEIAENAFSRISDGDGVGAFSSGFRFDELLLTVASTSPAEGSVVPLPFATLDLHFNEAYDPGSVDLADFLINQGNVSDATPVDADTLRLTLSGVTQEGTLTLDIAAGALTDVYGNPGGAYSASYTLDFAAAVPYPTPLESKAPLGSLIYDPTQAGFVSFVGDTDTFTITVDPGQKLTVVVDPNAALRPKVELLRGLSGNAIVGAATAAAAGQDAVIQTVATDGQLGSPGSGPTTYRVRVSGAGGTTGGYTLQVILNAAVEAEGHDGPINDTRAVAQDLTPSFLSFTSAVTSTPSGPYPGRGAVLGQTEQRTTAVFLADFESGDQGFTVDNTPLDPFYLEGLWHLSEGRGDQPGHSASHSFYYGFGEGPDGGGSIHSPTKRKPPPPSSSTDGSPTTLPTGGARPNERPGCEIFLHIPIPALIPMSVEGRNIFVQKY